MVKRTINIKDERSDKKKPQKKYEAPEVKKVDVSIEPVNTKVKEETDKKAQEDMPKFADTLTASEMDTLNKILDIENKERELERTKAGEARKVFINYEKKKQKDIEELVKKARKINLNDEDFNNTNIDYMRDPLNFDNIEERMNNIGNGSYVPAEIKDNVKPVEDNINPSFKDVLDKLNSIYEAKNKDYGSSFDKTFEEFGTTALLIRLSDKYNRLVSLHKNNNQNEVKDESFSDTLLDLANYAILGYLALNKK